tara:strand:- start:25 stop:882 length:858 start_codon:yes stop_codon:yes gene_type:complete
MWALLNSDEDTIEEIIINPKPMTIGGIQHPKGIFTLWTVAERKSVGLVPVTTTGSHLDTTYYTEDNESYAIAEDKASVVRTIGTKAADKVLATIKSEQVANAKGMCNGLLKNTDWYVVRKAEASTAIPSKITAYRTAVRTVYAAAKSVINGAANISALVAVNATTAGATESISVNGTSTGVVSASNNTITKNGHGFVDDERIKYSDGQDDDDNPIKGLVSGEYYYVHSAATNTFKLSLTPSSFGDEAIISLTGVADGGTAHTFTSVGLLTIVKVWPNESDLAYKL